MGGPPAQRRVLIGQVAGVGNRASDLSTINIREYSTMDTQLPSDGVVLGDFRDEFVAAVGVGGE